MNNNTVEWLMNGDPSIRWQVMRDLLNEPGSNLESERRKIEQSGWGRELLLRQGEDGKWGKGIYGPKWISTTYTLLLLRQMGLPPDNQQASRGCEHFFERGLEKDGGINLFKSMNHSETCVNGMIFGLLSYFRFPDDRIHDIADFLLKDQMLDGGWNCEKYKGATHSSFHSTISVLEGFADYCQTFPNQVEKVRPAVLAAHQFILKHRIYCSDHTGKPVDTTMTLMHFPPRWHYDFLRALDYFQSDQTLRDERMEDAITLLLAKRNESGQWILNSPWAGRVFFKMEDAGQPSRWNTLRAMRVLKWWSSDK